MLTSTDRMPTDETSLLAAARAGSTDALGALYTRHAAAIFRLAHRMLGSTADAEDVLQDVFVGLPDALQRYEERGTFEPWLKRVAARYTLMKLRARGRRREDSIDALDLDPGAEPVKVVDRIAVERAVQGLPTTLRVVFHLKEVEGYSHAEIGELLGITSGTSAARLFRAWKILRKEARPS